MYIIIVVFGKKNVCCVVYLQETARWIVQPDIKNETIISAIFF